MVIQSHLQELLLVVLDVAALAAVVDDRALLLALPKAVEAAQDLHAHLLDLTLAPLQEMQHQVADDLVSVDVLHLVSQTLQQTQKHLQTLRALSAVHAGIHADENACNQSVSLVEPRVGVITRRCSEVVVADEEQEEREVLAVVLKQLRRHLRQQRVERVPHVGDVCATTYDSLRSQRLEEEVF